MSQQNQLLTSQRYLEDRRGNKDNVANWRIMLWVLTPTHMLWVLTMTHMLWILKKARVALARHFEMTNLVLMTYILGIEVIHQDNGIFIS